MNNYQNQKLSINSPNNFIQGLPNSSSKFELEETQDQEINKSQKKNKGIKRQKEDTVRDNTENTFNLYNLGDVELAERHGSANKPLKQLKEFDSSVEFCPCCNLPAKKDGYLEEFKTCDKSDDFSNCGQGVVLYYSFIKYVIMVMIVSCICISCFNIYFSYKYTHELNTVCNNYYKSELAPNHNEVYYEYCKLYITEADSDSEYYSPVDSFFSI